MALMDRYVFYFSGNADQRLVREAKKTLEQLGATVVKTVAGSMLVEGSSSKVKRAATALPDWRYSLDTRTHRMPEKKALTGKPRSAVRPSARESVHRRPAKSL
jgi:hypothetical protein